MTRAPRSRARIAFGNARACAIVLPCIAGACSRGVPSAPADDARHDAPVTRAIDASVPPSACPDGMVLVDGMACPAVTHHCLEWIDPPTSRYAHFRCARYASPATCAAPRVHKRFCIDQRERTEPGRELPRNFASWTDATHVCEAAGARLCGGSEWTFACEGEEMRPYAYGWSRDSAACNVDIGTGLGSVGHLKDHRAPASAHPRCVSPFGVFDMAGNVDEWTTREGLPEGKREIMMGSWWMPGRHTCRGGQAGHGAHYGGMETGVRCCADAKP